jgi:hypothetical protein
VTAATLGLDVRRYAKTTKVRIELIGPLAAVVSGLADSNV